MRFKIVILTTVNLHRGCRNVTLQQGAYKEIVPQVSALDDHQTVRFTVSKLQFTGMDFYSLKTFNNDFNVTFDFQELVCTV